MKGTPGYFDYDFLEDPMSHYYNYITDCFMYWLRDPEGVVNHSRWARICCLVFNHYFRMTDDVIKLQKEIAEIIVESNHFILDSMQELSVVFESGQYLSDKRMLKRFRITISARQSKFVEKINNAVSNLYRIYKYQIFEPLYNLL
jgi:hypothetical protein